MAINLPESAKEVQNRMQADIKKELSAFEFLRNSIINAFTFSFSGAIYDVYRSIQKFIDDLFLQTASGDFLERFGFAWKIERNPATQGEGNISVTGVSGTSIPISTQYQGSDSQVYTTQETKSIVDVSLSVTSITRTGTTATVTTASTHNLFNGASITISGANETDYNGTFTIDVVTSLTEFEYTVSGSPATPATGTLLVDYTLASISIRSESFGQDVNLDNGATMNITTPIAGADDTATVQFDGISGGTDVETDDDLRGRIQDVQGGYFGNYSASTIEAKAKEVSGVTRVWVFEVTPAIGQTTVYFVRDDDDNIIPSGSEVTDVKNELLTIKPANTADSDLIVSAPTPLVQDFIFSAISPNTDSMQEAIEDTLIDFFATQSNVGETILELTYESVIINTVDPGTGVKLVSFTLTSPSGDINVSTGELATFGSVTF